MARRDPHSYNDDTQAETEALAWIARLDFASRTISAEATLAFRAPGSGTLDLDTRDLAIESVTDLAGAPLAYTVHPPEPFLGARLAIELPSSTPGIRIRYRTAPSASALQWLAPAQTSGKQQPFLFSQCQAIHARSVIPLQDTPRLRIRYTAELHVPAALRVVMAAAPVERTEQGELAIERWEMPQPIPPYLLAFAVGDLASRDLSPRSRVWAEPTVVDAAAWEFAGVEDMVRLAESLFGPYDWDRFDILAMPPSFPYGGMENPRLTFITPSVIAGDRSLVGVVAHELAHSWTGNLVTNANAEHFWLNEGFTVYAERRILEALDGVEVAALDAALGRRALDESIERFAKRPELTKLRTELWGVDPDDAYSQVPYEKGYFFLATLEQAVGRAAFDAWLKTYLATFRFQAITTDDFIAHFERAFPGTLARVDATTWIDGTGMPEITKPASTKLERIEAIGAALPPPDVARAWTPTEWMIYLESLPKTPASLPLCRALDTEYHLTDSTNYDVVVVWLELSLRAGHDVLARVEQVLASMGRMKYLRPLYKALAGNVATRARAHRVFEQLRPTYHPIAQQVVEMVLRDATMG
ncbi:MAG TPA: M1 family metallopeptidase [Kofleriaceae bacterium]|nr:M1 family metallopeptidase [Kofleriaceae bacterium]